MKRSFITQLPASSCGACRIHPINVITFLSNKDIKILFNDPLVIICLNK